jgi:hypothetical protein
MIIESYLETAGVAATLLRTPELAAAWTKPSALAQFQISGLAGHIGGAVFRVEASLDTEVPDEPLADAVEYFAAAASPSQSPDTPVSQRIRQLSEEAAGTGPDDLADRVDAALARLTTVLPTLPPDRPVFGIRRVMRLDQWLVTRLVELAVHIDDLAVSLDVPTPAIPPAASDLALTTLVRIAAAHHGPVTMLRALSRRERATGPINAF